MSKREIKKLDRLCYHFAIGYECLDYADHCITLFKGDGVATLLGHLFRIHNIPMEDMPRAIYYAAGGQMHYESQSHSRYSLQKVANGIMLIETHGPKKGEARHLERKPSEMISAMEIPQSNSPQMDFISRVASALV